MSGRCFDDRKDWLEARLIELAGLFSISVFAYAVMSNHVHVVVHVFPAVAGGWSDEEVAQRWTQLFPARIGGEIDADACQRKAWVLTGNADRIALLRQRLGDLSWFMRCLSDRAQRRRRRRRRSRRCREAAEPLARLANQEDRCTGRFWEGRYRCQALLDDNAVLACMEYVDLNPVRAGIADDLQSSAHTSVRARLAHSDTEATQPIEPIAGPSMVGFLPISEQKYIALVDWAGRRLHPGKRGVISGAAPSLLPSRLDQEAWLEQVRGIEARFCRAIGNVQALLNRAREMGQRWLMVRRVERLA